MKKTDALKASLPMCKARNPAITFWVSSRPFDSSPNHWGAFADELHSQKTKINQRQKTCDGSKHQVSISPTWPWICESRWRWCCQLKWSCFSLDRFPAAWSQRPTGRHWLSGQISTGSSQGSSSGSAQKTQRSLFMISRGHTCERGQLQWLLNVWK